MRLYPIDNARPAQRARRSIVFLTNTANLQFMVDGLVKRANRRGLHFGLTLPTAGQWCFAFQTRAGTLYARKNAQTN